MAEIPLSALDPRVQKQAENARHALERGNTEYALQITGEILHKHPGCLQVRKIQRAAQHKLLAGKSRPGGKVQVKRGASAPWASRRRAAVVSQSMQPSVIETP